MLGGARVDGAVSVVPSAVVRTAVIWTERGEGEREKTRAREGLRGGKEGINVGRD